MKKTFIWIISSLTLTLFASGCASKPAKPAEPYRVLFIGDSTTSRNDIPGKFKRLAELGGHPDRQQLHHEYDLSREHHSELYLLRQCLELVENQQQLQHHQWPQHSSSAVMADQPKSLN